MLRTSPVAGSKVRVAETPLPSIASSTRPSASTALARQYTKVSSAMTRTAPARRPRAS